MSDDMKPLPKKKELVLAPTWVRCPDCDDWYCVAHDKHTADCECPAIEEWFEAGVDPYTDFVVPVGQAVVEKLVNVQEGVKVVTWLDFPKVEDLKGGLG